MSLDVLLDPIPDRNPAVPCKVGRIISDLEEPYKSAVVNLVSTSWPDGGLTDEQLASRLTKAGFPIGASTIRTHRKAMCNCE